MLKTLTVLGAAALCPLILTTQAQADVAANKATAIAAMQNTLAALNPDAVDSYFVDPYIQHNPMAPSGVDALKGLIVQLGEMTGGVDGAVTVDVARVIAEDDLVVMHNVWTGLGPVPLVAFDVLRFDDDGKIVEHWDNLIPLAEAPNASGRTQTDGATQITDLDKTEANKALVEDFVTTVLIGGDSSGITSFVNPAKYMQHNPQVADGLDGLGAFLGYLAENNIAFAYTDLHLTVAEGNFVFTAAEGIFGETSTAYFDLFRVEDGLIVEHWDVIADMPTGDLPAGYPGKF